MSLMATKDETTLIRILRTDRERIERRKVHRSVPVSEVVTELLDMAEQKRAGAGARDAGRERRAS